MPEKINIAVSGGPGTGKSTLAAGLFSELKVSGLDYDLIAEERRKLRGEMGDYRSPFERMYMWRQQEREELRSNAVDGFVTDTPLFHLYIQARWYAQEPRDALAVRELFRMCQEAQAANRYQVIVLPQNPDEVPYRTDQVRTSTEADARQKHLMIKSFVEHFWPKQLWFVSGPHTQRVAQVMSRVSGLRTKR